MARNGDAGTCVLYSWAATAVAAACILHAKSEQHAVHYYSSRGENCFDVRKSALDIPACNPEI